MKDKERQILKKGGQGGNRGKRRTVREGGDRVGGREW